MEYLITGQLEPSTNAYGAKKWSESAEGQLRDLGLDRNHWTLPLEIRMDYTPGDGFPRSSFHLEQVILRLLLDMGFAQDIKQFRNRNFITHPMDDGRPQVWLDIHPVRPQKGLTCQPHHWNRATTNVPTVTRFIRTTKGTYTI